jgi:RHS repeat-associated protein
VTYQHNGQGQRVKKDDGSAVTLFAYDESGQLIGEYDGSGNAIQETVWFNGAPVAVLKGSNHYYVHTDHLGTPRVITDGNTVIWRWESDPFGTNAAQEDPDGDLTDFSYRLRFPGQYYDQETGLHYNYHRTYDPATGRYLESDPIGLEGGLNTYGYVGGNPLRFADPLGLAGESPLGDLFRCTFRPEARGCGKDLFEQRAREIPKEIMDQAGDLAEEGAQCAVEAAECVWTVVIGDDIESQLLNAGNFVVREKTKFLLRQTSKKAAKKFIPIYNGVDTAKDIYLVLVCVTD